MAGGTAARGSTALAGAALVAALAALAISLRRPAEPAPEDWEDSEADLVDRESVDNRITDLERRAERTESRVAALEERVTKAEGAVEGARALAGNAMQAAAKAGGPPPPAAGGAGAPGTADPAAEAEADGILARLREGRLPAEGEVFRFFERARELGILDDAIREAEAWAKAHPGEAHPWNVLATACIARLMTVPEGPARGEWSTKSIAACDQALKADPEDWGAQYLRAMNLSQWPAFTGKQPEAIKGFEKLIEQQERSSPDPKYAQTYFQLGNTYRAAGNVEKARETYRRGLERFPDDPRLRDQLELLDKR